MITLGFGLNKIIKKLKKEEHVDNIVYTSREEFRTYLKSMVLSFVPILNIIIPSVFIFNFDEMYEKIKDELIKDSFERVGQQDLEKYCGLKAKDEEIKNNEKQEVDVTEFENMDAQEYADNLRKSLDKEYAKLSDEERLVYLKRELKVLILLREKLEIIEAEQDIENDDSKKVKKIEENQKYHN